MPNTFLTQSGIKEMNLCLGKCKIPDTFLTGKACDTLFVGELSKRINLFAKG